MNTKLYKWCARLIPVVFLTSMAAAQSGRIERGTISSAALAGSRFGDSTNRSYAVYLPASYAQGPRRYPVFYLLHGWTENLDTHLGETRTALDTLILARQIGEMIAVFVDGQNALRGSWYRSSPVTGDYETYIARDLVDLIDARYLTLATNVSRGITGFSMGGYGALHLALKFPERFSVVVAQSGYYDTTDSMSDAALKEIARVNPTTSSAIAGMSLRAQALFPFLPAAVPDPGRPPYYYDPPFVYTNSQYLTNQTAVLGLRDADILQGAVGQFLQQTVSLRGIKIVHGSADPLIPVSQARTLHQALLNSNVEHLYEEHSGSHQFMPNLSLTFLSQKLVGAERYITPPRLSATWEGGDIALRFTTQTNVDYQLEQVAELAATNLQWTALQVIKGTGQMAQVLLPANTVNGFLRLRASNN